MGLFFQSSSWRKPLQLIECWLPEPVREGRSAAAPLPVSATPTAAVRRFAQAGWLGRPAANEALLHSRHDGRVALAGRIDDVCRELDRLADRETRARSRCTRQAR